MLGIEPTFKERFGDLEDGLDFGMVGGLALVLGLIEERRRESGGGGGGGGCGDGGLRSLGGVAEI